MSGNIEAHIAAMDSTHERIILHPHRVPSEYSVGEILRGLYNYPDLRECAYAVVAMPVWREMMERTIDARTRGGPTALPTPARWEGAALAYGRRDMASHRNGLDLIRLKADIDQAIEALPEPLQTAAHMRWREAAGEVAMMKELRCRRRRMFSLVDAARRQIVALLLA